MNDFFELMSPLFEDYEVDASPQVSEEELEMATHI